MVPLYNMLPEAEQWRATEGLVYQSRASLSEPVHFAAGDVSASVSKTYIVCAQDMAAPPEVQRAWAEGSGCHIMEIESDHSPFMDDARAALVVNAIVDMTEGKVPGS